jgi:hypothetical protein
MNNIVHSVASALIWGFCLLPAVPLAFSCSKVKTASASTKVGIVHLVLLVLVSASFLLAWSVLTHPDTALGPVYGATSQAVHICNNILMIVATVIAAAKMRELSPLYLAAAGTTLLWGYLGLIRSLV